ncbi:MAPEG family protein [Paraglaciecola sp. L3A3]|uniref:MAPEG family protein n=1 Tax=Paraglaciecola sp. L3A3 TaxID=2686358 RepID=UPI00131E23FB|nr:MAPEG family protein [Paraglaciecola sp. L3A3]
MHTPITAFYAGLLGILFLYLSILVIRGRRATKISLGDGGDKHFQQLIRAHGNFSEYTPVILILLFVAEINGSNGVLLHCSGAALLFGRFIHAFGLRRHTGVSWQRVAGMLATFSALLCLAVLNILILY